MAVSSLHSLSAWQAARFERGKEVDLLLDQYYCEERCGHNALCVRDDLLIWGGYNERDNGRGDGKYCDSEGLWSFNLDLDSWSKFKTSGEIPKRRSGACSGLVWPNWYIIGGFSPFDNVNDVHSLNLITLTWGKVDVPQTGSAALAPRDKASAWVHGDRIYIFGGYGGLPLEYLWTQDEDEYTRDYEGERGWNNQTVYLDVNKKCWVNPKIKGPRPSPRAAQAAICVDGRVFVFGGRHQKTRLNDLHCLDLDSHTWSGSLQCTAPLPPGRTWHSISQLDRGELLVYGGFSQDQGALDDAWLINIDTLSWSEVSKGTGFPRLWHTASTNIQGDILVFGGCENNIMDRETTNITSPKVLLLRTRPFSLERLCLHAIHKAGAQLRPQWELLPKSAQEWLTKKEEEALSAPACTRWYTRCERGLGPGLGQLAVLTPDQEVELPRSPNRSLFDYFFNN